MDVATGLTRALVRAGIPIVSVSIGDPENRSTWVVQYVFEATDAQQAAGEAIRATYSVATDTASVDEDAAARLDDKRFKALAIATAQRLGISPAVFRDQIITIYKGLP